MASVFDKINKISVAFKPFSNLTSLSQDVPFKVINMSKADTPFGERVRVELQEYLITLGEKYNDLSEEDLRNLNEIAEGEMGLSLIKLENVGRSIRIEFLPNKTTTS